MFSKADNSAAWAVGLALVMFFIGGLLTTVVPPLVDKSWGRLHDVVSLTQQLLADAAVMAKGGADLMSNGEVTPTEQRCSGSTVTADD